MTITYVKEQLVFLSPIGLGTFTLLMLLPRLNWSKGKYDLHYKLKRLAALRYIGFALGFTFVVICIRSSGIINLSRATSRLRWLKDNETNVSTSISALTLRKLIVLKYQIPEH